MNFVGLQQTISEVGRGTKRKGSRSKPEPSSVQYQATVEEKVKGGGPKLPRTIAANWQGINPILYKLTLSSPIVFDKETLLFRI